MAFRSHAGNLVPGANGAGQVFVRDRRRGITLQASLTWRDRQPDGGASDVAVSGDGRYVAFSSSASNLVPGDTNRHSIPGDEPGDSQSERADDIFVRDLWRDETLPPTARPASDVFVHDLKRGTTVRVGVSSSGAEGDDDSLEVALSPDGALWRSPPGRRTSSRATRTG